MNLNKIKIPTQAQYQEMLNYMGEIKDDAYYTPQEIIKFCEDYILSHNEIPTKYVFEPSCGIGSFLDIKPFEKKDCVVYATEIDKNAKKITELREVYNNKVLHKPTKKLYQIYNLYLEQFFLGKKKDDIFAYFPEAKKNKGFDLIIGNPPYGVRKKSNPPYDANPKHILCPQYESYFLTQCFELLRKGGYLMFVMPYNFICNNHLYNKVKETMLLNGEFTDAYRFCTFFKRTKIIVDLVIFKRTTDKWEVLKK